LSRGYSSSVNPKAAEYDDYGVLLIGKLRRSQLRAREKRQQLSLREARAGFVPIRQQMVELPLDLHRYPRYF